MARSNWSVVSGCVLFFVLCAVSSGFSVGARRTREAGLGVTDAYSPVAPVDALIRALRLNLKVIGQWLDDGDFDSAAETAERVKLLLMFCELQSRDESWLGRIALFRSQCDKLITGAKSKDAAACMAELMSCSTSLMSLEQAVPSGDRPSVDDLKPSGQVRTFMKLLDGSYTDAKLAKSVDELSAMAYTIAEATNIAQFLKTDSDWRARAGDVREAALKVAKLKPDADLKVARQDLKNVYERCQACHKVFRP